MKIKIFVYFCLVNNFDKDIFIYFYLSKKKQTISGLLTIMNPIIFQLLVIWIAMVDCSSIQPRQED